jgi:hypothetical protein
MQRSRIAVAWWLLALSVLGLSGCASIFEGTSQDIDVVTNPPSATCKFERHGETIGMVSNTPGTVTVRKTKYDITIRCDKPGYQEATYLNHSGTSSAIAGNVAADLILTLGVSSIVDSADGADNQYDSAVTLTLSPVVADQTPTAGPPAAGSSPVPAPSTSIDSHLTPAAATVPARPSAPAQAAQ